MEPFVYLAVFLLVAVIAFVARWLQAQMEAAPTEPREAGPWTSPHRPATVITAAAPAASGEPGAPPGRAGADAPASLPRRPPARLAARGSVRDLRRGILWMTILGRCRGLEPPRRIADSRIPPDTPS